MKHLGDITGINGAEIEPVWCVTFGAPCQDLSVAGARAGMKSDLMGDEENTRSGLFFHAIRLIKEMREHEKRSGRTAELIRPRYTVYENVTGAFSSNKGADFQAVLNETIRVVCPEAPDVPIPSEGWHYAGTLMGDGWSVAWRTHDAQHWGTPQRRKRISVVADYGGATAPEILFDKCFGGKPGRTVQSFSESMSGHTQSCGSSGQGASENSPQGIGESGENDVDGEPPPQDLRCTRKRGGCDFPDNHRRPPEPNYRLHSHHCLTLESNPAECTSTLINQQHYQAEEGGRSSNRAIPATHRKKSPHALMQATETEQVSGGHERTYIAVEKPAALLFGRNADNDDPHKQ